LSLLEAFLLNSHPAFARAVPVRWSCWKPSVHAGFNRCDPKALGLVIVELSKMLGRSRKRLPSSQRVELATEIEPTSDHIDKKSTDRNPAIGFARKNNVVEVGKAGASADMDSAKEESCLESFAVRSKAAALEQLSDSASASRR